MKKIIQIDKMNVKEIMLIGSLLLSEGYDVSLEEKVFDDVGVWFLIGERDEYAERQEKTLQM